MRLKIFVLFMSILLLAGCSAINNLITTGPEISIKKGFDGNGIAVLNFTKIGSLPNDAGRITADKLSDALFFITKFNVVDRSRVNDSQTGMELATTESLSAEQIQKLGQKLKANYLVLGRIHCISNDDFFKSDDDKKLNISFRILSVANQDIIGLASFTCKYNDNLVEQIQEMINRIVYKSAE